jgi:transposase
MPSNPQLKLMTELLKIEGINVINYSLIEPMGMVLYLENIDRQATCIHCGSITRKLHQNHELTVRDLPFGERPIYSGSRIDEVQVS